MTSQVSNYAGGENVGASWTDKVMSMKSHDSTQPADDGAGADEDEWVRLVEKCFTSKLNQTQPDSGLSK